MMLAAGISKTVFTAFVVFCVVVHAGGSFSGDCGKGITWYLDSGTLTVKGKGNMTKACSLTEEQKKSVTSVIIEDGVKSIADSAFREFGIESVTLGESLEDIGYSAFRDNKLTSLTIPNSVKNIGDGAFFENRQLESLKLGESVQFIGLYAFSCDDGWTSCNQLKSLTLPDSVTYVAKGAFSHSQKLESLILSESLREIEEYSFYYCERLTTLTIPDSVVTIGESAFESCTSLKSLSIGNSVTRIGVYAFSKFRVKTLTIPNSVVRIGEGAFAENPILKSLTISDSVEFIGELAFAYTGVKHVTFGKSLRTISNGAFFGTNLTSVLIPKSVTYIGDGCNYNGAARVGAFSSCMSLARIDVEEGNEAYYSIDGVLFEKDEYTDYRQSLLRYPEGKMDKDYIIPDGTAHIERFAFKESLFLENVTIPSSVYIVYGEAFADCPKLQSVAYLGFSDPRWQGSDYFKNCPELSHVCVPKDYESKTFLEEENLSPLSACGIVEH